MSNAVVKVSFLQGQAWAKAPDGTMRALAVGSVLNDDDLLVTAQGARVELDVGNGEPLVVNGGMEVGMSRDFAAETATDPDEALLNDASVQEALTVLQQGGDLLDELEETAAGNTGGGDGEGSNFVRLTRIVESTDPQAFYYSSAAAAGLNPVVFDADYINRAPLVTDQTIALNEDEPLSGQIIATDIENDVLTFALTTPPTNGVVQLDPLTGQFTFTPNANYNGPDGFVVTVSDSRGNSTTTSIALNIAPVNDAPTTNNIALTTDEDVAVSGQVIAQDIENDALSYVVSIQPANGSVVLDPVTGEFVYTPNANYNGSDSFVVTISDGNGGTTTSTVTIGVTPVNDAPASADQNLSTPEDTPLNGAIVASDVDGDTLSYAVSTNPANGTLVLNPATGSFTYTPNANYNGSDSFVVTISDGNGGTTTSTVTIGVTPVNDAPVSGDQNLSTPEDTPLNGAIVASDVDGDTLSYAVSTNPANGTLVLNPATGSFVYTPNANYNGSDSFVVTISDGNGGTTTSTVTIGVTPVNDAPVSADQNLTTAEDTLLNGAIVASDVDGDTLAYAVSTGPTNGTLVLNPATGTFTYTPNANYNGSDSFIVTISDGNGGTTTSTVTIGVTPVNDAPASADQNLSTPEDTPLNGAIVASDVDGDTLSYAVSTGPTNGTLVLNPATGTFTYTPNANYNGSDSFIVTISDGNGGTTTSTVTIGVTPVNDAPASADQNLSTPEDTPLNGAIVASDVDGDTLSYAVSTGPTNGTLVLNPATGSFVYTPNANYNGSDSFVVTISDGNGGTTTSSVTIGVTPVNDAPVSADQNLTTAEATLLNGAIVASDVDGDTLAYAVSTGPTNGTLALNPATGSFVYTPNANYNGSDSFVVTISDGNGGTTTSTVTIGVTPVNDAPVSAAQNLTTAEGAPLNGAIVASDVDGDTLAYAVSTNPANGTLVLNPATGSFTYTPNANYNGSDSFVVTISDGNGGTTTSTVTIGVTPVNDAPASADQNLSTPEDTPLNGAIVASDVDGDTLSYAVSTNPANGTLVLNPATGSFVYTPNANYNGSDSFVVTISDGNGGSTTSTVAIGVTPVNDAPVSADQNLTTAEDTPLNGAIVASDVDGDTLAYAVSTNPANGTLVLNPATGSFVYTPNANYNGSDSFVVTVSDGNGGTATSTVAIGVIPVNDAPVSADQNLTTSEGTPLNGAIVASDVDGDTLSYMVSANPANGTLTLNPANGTFTYTPNSNYNGNDSFVVTISDGNGGTTTSTVNIGVTPVNDAPVSADQNLTTAEDTPLTGAIVASDVDGDTLAYAVSTNPANGTLVLNPATGSFTYTPNANYNGSDSFVVTISDGNGGTTTSTVTIGVTPVNDAPVSADQNLTTAEDTPLNGAIVASDVDGDTLSYAVSTNPANGTLVLNPATGSFVYTPNANYNGSDSFVVTVSDGNGGTTTSTVAIGVTPVNDAPVSADQNLTTAEDTPLNGAIVASDVDGDTLAYAVSTNPANGTLVLNPATGTFTYTPNSNYNGSDSFVVTISDGNGGTTTSTVSIGVTPVNNTPVSADQNLTTAEDTPLNGTIVASDVDGDTLGYSITTSPANGTVALNPVTGAFTYTPNLNYNGSDSFVVTISDGQGGSTTSTINIGVTPVNDVPVAADDFFTIDEDTPLVLTQSQLLANDTDVDGDSLSIITLQNAINGSLSVVGGNIVFTPAPDYSGPASFRYNISDGKGGFSTATVHITVNPVNDPTVMNPEVVLVAEDSFVQGNVLTNDSDVDDVLSIQQFEVNGITYAPGTATNIVGVGSFSLSSTGDYLFTPIANYNGPVPVITYTTNTGASSTLTLTVTPINDVPVAEDDAFSVVANSSLTISPAELLANDSDIDGDSLSVSTIFSVTNGTVSISGGSIIFTPTAGYSGPASFRYSVSDGKGGFDTATVSINVTPAPNLPPETQAVTVSGDEDTLISITLAGSDADGSVVGYVIKSLPANGLLYSDAAMTSPIAVDDLVTGAVYFMPTADWNGTTGFTYAARDNQGAEDATPAGVVINVAPVADPAVLGTGSGSVKEDTPAQSTASGTLSIIDPDAGEASFNSQTNTAGTYGNFSVTSAGAWTYNINNSLPAVQQLKEGESRTEIFTVTSLDGTSTSVTITVRGTNDAPTATADTASVGQGQTLTLTAAQLLGNDTDPDGDTLTIASVQGASTGSVSLVGGNVVFTPAAGYHGPASFTYTINDGQGGSATATVNVTVNRINAAPVAVDDPASVQFSAGGTQGWSQSFIKSVTATGGTLALNNADGVAGAIGVAGRGNTTEVDDEIQNGESLTLSFVSPVMDARFGFAKLDFNTSGPHETGLWIAYLDGIEVSRGQFQPTDASRSGTVQVRDSSGKFVAFDQIRFDTATTGSDYVVTSFAASRSTVMTKEGGTIQQTVAGGVLANDTDADAGDTLSVAAVRTGAETASGVAGSVGVALQGAYGSLTLNTDGSYTYVASHSNTLKAGEIVKDYFTYTVVDSQSATDTATLTITVVGDGAINGTAGNDVLVGTAAADVIIGGAGNDTLTGGAGADTFKWQLGDAGTAGQPAIDQVTDFVRGAGGDRLDLRDLLLNENSTNLTNYLHFTSDGANTTVSISTTGGFTGSNYAAVTDQQIVLTGVNLTGSDNGIINQLKSNGNLITD